MEPHIRPFQLTSGAFLPTSPEFAMKRLLVGGLEKIFQVSRCFRDEPPSPHHRPEFLMLEWYRAHAELSEILVDVEELLRYLAQSVTGSTQIRWGAQTIDLGKPFLKSTPRALFLERLGIDIATASLSDFQEKANQLGHSCDPSFSWDDLYFLLWLNEIEPHFPKDQPIFITDYPASQSALAEIVTHPDGTRWASRFEIYAGGLELGNAFQELTKPQEQRLRFEKDLELRRNVYGDDFGVRGPDEGFLEALEEGLPRSAGIAVGVDRLVMLFANETDIGYTLWIDPVSRDP
jgi:lysyl-tRNA synthetase class 2